MHIQFNPSIINSNSNSQYTTTQMSTHYEGGDRRTWLNNSKCFKDSNLSKSGFGPEKVSSRVVLAQKNADELKKMVDEF